MATVVSTHSATDRSTNTVTLTATPPSGSNVVAFLFANVMRNIGSVSLTGVTCGISGGSTETMGTLYSDTDANNNRWYAYGLYKLEDPIDTLGSGEHVFTVTTSGSAQIAVTVVYVSGVTEIRSATATNTVASSITLPVTNEFTPSLILAGGLARIGSSGATQVTNTAPTGDTVGLTKVSTGTGINVDIVAFTGYALAETVDTYDLGWSFGSGVYSALMAVELVGEYEPAALTLGAVAPTVILGDILIEDLAAALALGGDVGEVGMGSIPPVQVIGRGNLYLATNARNLTAILLATTGDKWTIATASDATEQLGCTIIRRKGYITPR